MVSVTQRITQYNREVGQPRGGLLNPKLFTVTQHADAHGALDGKQENLHASVVGLAVDYLTRLAHTQLLDDEPAQTLGDVFRASLLGARKVSEQTEHTSALDDAVAALGKVTFSPSSVDSTRFIFNVDETAVRVACQLATYDVALRAGVGFYNPAATQLVPDHLTVAHILTMVNRAGTFFAEYGPITSDGFLFVGGEEYLAGGRGGYTDLVDSGDGDFLTKDTLWDFKVSASKPNKDHTLQVLMYFLMGKESGLEEFADLTHVGIFNPRLNQTYRHAIEDVPAEVIDAVRRGVIGYPS